MLAITLLALASASHAQGAALRMALIPYLSPNVLIPLFQPVAAHLERETGQQVELYTAPGIRPHIERILQPDYDIVYTAPHLGRLAQLEAGYVPIASFSFPLRGALTVRKDGAVRSLEDLRGKKVALHDRLVLNSILMLAELAERGIQLEDMTIVRVASQNSALLSVVNRDVDAAITVNFALDRVPEQHKPDLWVIHQTEDHPERPPNLILVHPNISQSELQRLQSALLSFPETPEGQRFLAASSYKGLTTVSEAGLRSLDRYLPELRRLLSTDESGH
jgi:phosphonate transport system substrate-binding protein